MNNYRFSDIHIGLEHSFDKKVTTNMMDKFLDISGDSNPLHIDCDYSKEKGFQDKVVYGLLTSAFYSTLVGVHLPGKYCILQGIEIQFSKPVFINDDLKIFGKVSYMNETVKQIEIKAFIMNQKNQKVSRAKIKVGMFE